MKFRIFSVTAKQVRYTNWRGVVDITHFDTRATSRMAKKYLGRYEVPESWFKDRVSFSVDGQPFKDQLSEWLSLGYKVK